MREESEAKDTSSMLSKQHFGPFGQQRTSRREL